MRRKRFPLLLAVLAILCFIGSPANAKDRSKIPERETWDLTDLYPSDQAWKTAS